MSFTVQPFTFTVSTIIFYIPTPSRALQKTKQGISQSGLGWKGPLKVISSTTLLWAEQYPADQPGLEPVQGWNITTALGNLFQYLTML